MRTAKEVVNAFRDAQAYRQNYENLWDRISRKIDPRQNNFAESRGSNTPRMPRREQIFDSTATNALRRYVAGMEAYLTPSTQYWQRVSFSDRDLVKKYPWLFQTMTDTMFRMRNSRFTNYRSANNEVFHSGGLFGTGCMYISEVPGRGIFYRHVPLRQMYGCANYLGQVDTFFRKFSLNKRQAMQEFGDLTPQCIKDSNDNNRLWEFLHAVYPNDDNKGGRYVSDRYKWATKYILLDKDIEIYSGGYTSCPYMMGKPNSFPDDLVYGYSPAMECLAEIATLNHFRRTNLRIGDRMADPNILTSEEGIINPDALATLGGIVHGGLSEDGRPRVGVMQLPGNVNICYEELERSRKVINDSFMVTLFQVFQDTPQMTATEVMARQQEKAAVLAPIAGSYKTSYIDPATTREFDIAMKERLFPEFPEEIVSALQAGEQFEFDYEPPAVKAQKMEQGVGVLNTINSTLPLVQLNPQLRHIYDAEKIVRYVNEFNCAPSDTLVSPDVFAQRVQAEQEQQMAAQLAAAAQPLAAAVKDVASAERDNAEMGNA